MFFDELIEYRNGVEILRIDGIAFGIQTVAPDFTIFNNELIGEAVLKHISVVVNIVKRDNDRLFATGIISVLFTMCESPEASVYSVQTLFQLTIT